MYSTAGINRAEADIVGAAGRRSACLIDVMGGNAYYRRGTHDRASILERLVPESGRAIFEAMHWMFDANRTTMIDRRRVTCPVLCVAGERDRIVSPAMVRRIARLYGGRARYELIPKAGHWLPGEPGWERIAAGSLNWLEQVVDREPRSVHRAR